ncbi:MAG: hypothetical protein HZA54_11410 [Planctomycetes bacterium]|nr:hypothetical protein [Planctomycetota bacterium]
MSEEATVVVGEQTLQTQLRQGGRVVSPRVPGLKSGGIDIVNGRVNLIEGDVLPITDDLRGVGMKAADVSAGLRVTFATENERREAQGGGFDGHPSPWRIVFASVPPVREVTVLFKPDAVPLDSAFREYSVRVQTSSQRNLSDTDYGNEPIKVRVCGPRKVVTLQVHVSPEMIPWVTENSLRPDLVRLNEIWKQAGIEVRFVERPDGSIDIHALNTADTNDLYDGTTATPSTLSLFTPHLSGAAILDVFFVARVHSASTAPNGVVKSLAPGSAYCAIPSLDYSLRTRNLAHEMGHVLMKSGHVDSEPDAYLRLLYSVELAKGCVLDYSEVKWARASALAR